MNGVQSPGRENSFFFFFLEWVTGIELMTVHLESLVLNERKETFVPKREERGPG